MQATQTLVSLGLPRTATDGGESFTSKQTYIAAPNPPMLTPKRYIRYFYLKKTKNKCHKKI